MVPSSFVAFGIGGLALVVAVFLVAAYNRAFRSPEFAGHTYPSPRWVLIAVGVWVALVGVLGDAGVLRRWDLRPPPFMIMMVVGVVLTVLAAGSRVGEVFARGLPLASLVGFHGFRLPLELFMHSAAVQGTMPPQMSFSGMNFDIVSGASALVVSWLIARGRAPRWLILSWAILSSTLLAIIVGIAVASTPFIAAFGPHRLNTFAAEFPFVWLPAVLVLAALFGEIIVFRRLLLETRQSPSRLIER